MNTLKLPASNFAKPTGTCNSPTTSLSPHWIAGTRRLLFSLLLMVMGAVGAHAQYITQYIEKNEGNTTVQGLQIVKYTGIGGDVSIPSHLVGPTIPNPNVPVQDYPVIDLGPNAFMWTPYTFDVTFEAPCNLTDIGSASFAYCTGLTSIALPTSGTMVGSSAFTNCTGLTSLTIPSSYQYVDASAFSTCTGITNISLPLGISLGSAVFQYCTGLTGIIIPDGAVVGDLAFNTCTGLKSLTLNDGAVSIGNGVFQNCSALQTVNDLPPPNNARPVGDVIFPISLRGIGGSAFDSCNRLTSITIPPYVNVIGSGAFSNCKHLTKITVSYHVSNIGDGAISNCPNLTNVVLPKSITYIGNSAFSNCPLLRYSTGTNDFTIPPTVTDIGPSAFSGCQSLSTINIPDSVTNIWNSAFANCAGLSSVTIGNGVTDIWGAAFAGCTGLASVTVGNSVTQIGVGAFSGCGGLATVLFMGDGPSPDTGAFDRNNLPLYYLAGASWWNPTFDGHPTVPWPGPVKGLTPNHGPAAGGTPVVIVGTNFTTATAVKFGNVAATSFHVDSATQITAIAPPAAEGQQVDVSVVTPLGTTTNKASDLFTYDNPVLVVTGLTPNHCSAAGSAKVVINGSRFTGATAVSFGATNVSFVVDSDTQITTTAPAGIEGQIVDVRVSTVSGISPNTAADDFLYSAAAYNFTNNNGAVTITGYTGAVGAVIIPTTVDGLPVTSIAASGFENCYGLTSVAIPSSVTDIGASAFKNCYGLTRITIPNSVTNVGASAFENCTGLVSVLIGDRLATIGTSAFSGCTGLTSVTFGNSSLTTIGDSAFQGCEGLPTLTLPNSVSSIGANAFFGCTGLDSISLGNNVQTIGAGAFEYCDGLSAITLPDSLTSIGANAFSHCNGLSQITIPNRVASIGADAFSACNQLSSITISNGIAKIWDFALSNCPVLTTVSIPNSVAQIGVSSFSNCPKLNNVTIPNTVTDIGDTAFAGCSGLTTVSIGNGVTNIGAQAFSATALTSIAIPDSVTSISDGAFSDCTKLVNLTIGNGVTNIGASAFNGCTSLSIVTVGTGVTSVGSGAFSGCTGKTSFLFLGNAPSPDPGVFSTNSMVVYYLSGATGWNPTFDGHLTAQWPGAITSITPNHGSASGGTSVAIAGPNLIRATAVSFGSVAATSFTVDPITQQITAVAPAGIQSQNVYVSVTMPNGTTPNTAACVFSYDSPAPTLSAISPSSGAAVGGDNVVITGSNFTGVTAVKFGVITANSFTVDSPGQITVVSPAGVAGQRLDVTVITSSGTTARTAADQFTYGIPLPSISGLNPSHGSAIGGYNVQIQGVNFNAATEVKFGAVAALSFTVDSATQITATAPAGTANQTVDVSVKTAQGLTAIKPADQFTYEVSGIPAPTVVSLSPNRGPSKGGTEVVITGTNLNGATAVKFGTVSAASFTIDSPTQITAISPVGTGGQQVDVQVSTPGGVSAVSAGDKFSCPNADWIDPIVTVTTPKAGKVGASFDVTGVAKDNQGIARVEVTFNGGPIQLATLGAFVNGGATFNLNGLTPGDGNNILVVQAVDFQENKSAPVTVVVNNGVLQPQIAGSYTGLLLAAPSVAASNQNTGLLNVSVNSAGLFTGKVTLGGFTVSISGIFGNTGVALFKPTQADSLALVGKATIPVALGSLAMTIDPSGVSGKIIGTLNDSNQNPVATFDADRAYFDGVTHLVNPQFLKNGGFHTVVFAGKAQTGNPAASTYPQGDGFGSFKVSSKGIATLKGTLADGTGFTAVAPLTKNYQWPCYAQLYSKHGSIAGNASLQVHNAVSLVRGLDLIWFRPGIPTSKYYPLGWTGGIAVDLLGSEYAVPPSLTNSVFPGLKPLDLVNGNATLTFADGKLASLSNPITKNINIDLANKVTNFSDSSFTMKLTASTGLIGGSFTHSDGTKPAFKGVILQNDVQGASATLNAGGYGFFLSTPPKVVGGLGEGGSMLLQSK